MTNLTYASMTDAKADKAQQMQLLQALDAWDRALCWDDSAAWQIKGKNGHIYTWGDGRDWLIYATFPEHPKAWTWAKKRLRFATVTQDGDDEGCLRLSRLPTTTEAAVLRDVIGIRRRMELTPAELERRQAQGRSLHGRPKDEGTISPQDAPE